MADNVQVTPGDYINYKQTKQLIPVCSQTLRNWANSGKVRTIRTHGNVRLYNKFDLQKLAGDTHQDLKRVTILYARVSSKKQEDDLNRQVEFLKTKHKGEHELIKDIGSGLNWKRKGFTTLLDKVMQGQVEEIVVAHRDRLARFCFDLIEWICEKHNTRIKVIGKVEKSQSETFTEDLLSIIHIYSCKTMGGRKYNAKLPVTDLSDSEAEDHDKTMDGL